MQFDWNEANISHIALHNVTPDEAEQVVENEPLDAGATLRGGEMRTTHLGETDAGRVLFVVVTERDGMHRVVTARDAHKKERAFYSKHKVTTHDTDPTDP